MLEFLFESNIEFNNQYYNQIFGSPDYGYVDDIILALRKDQIEISLI